MQTSESLSRYFPDHPPGWSDVILAILVLITLIIWTPQFFESTAISWPALTLSSIAIVAVFVLTQQSARVREFNQRLGDLPLVIGLAVVALGLAAFLVVAPNLPGADAVHVSVAMGVVIGSAMYLVAWILLTRAVKGW